MGLVDFIQASQVQTDRLAIDGATDSTLSCMLHAMFMLEPCLGREGRNSMTFIPSDKKNTWGNHKHSGLLAELILASSIWSRFLLITP